MILLRVCGKLQPHVPISKATYPLPRISWGSTAGENIRAEPRPVTANMARSCPITLAGGIRFALSLLREAVYSKTMRTRGDGLAIKNNESLPSDAIELPRKK